MSKKRNAHTGLQQYETTTIKKRDKENVKRIKKAGMSKLIPAMYLSEKQVRSRLACTAVERSDGASLLVGYLNLTE